MPQVRERCPSEALSLRNCPSAHLAAHLAHTWPTPDPHPTPRFLRKPFASPVGTGAVSFALLFAGGGKAKSLSWGLLGGFPEGELDVTATHMHTHTHLRPWLLQLSQAWPGPLYFLSDNCRLPGSGPFSQWESVHLFRAPGA